MNRSIFLLICILLHQSLYWNVVVATDESGADSASGVDVSDDDLNDNDDESTTSSDAPVVPTCVNDPGAECSDPGGNDPTKIEKECADIGPYYAGKPTCDLNCTYNHDNCSRGAVLSGSFTISRPVNTSTGDWSSISKEQVTSVLEGVRKDIRRVLGEVPQLKEHDPGKIDITVTVGTVSLSRHSVSKIEVQQDNTTNTTAGNTTTPTAPPTATPTAPPTAPPTTPTVPTVTYESIVSIQYTLKAVKAVLITATQQGLTSAAANNTLISWRTFEPLKTAGVVSSSSTIDDIKAMGFSIGVTATCGNGVLESGEDCDGTEFGTATCATLVPGKSGNLQCSATSCTVSTSLCGVAPPPTPSSANRQVNFDEDAATTSSLSWLCMALLATCMALYA